MDKESSLIVDDVVSLQSWHEQLRRTVRTCDLPAVQFRLPGLSPFQNDTLSALADRHRSGGSGFTAAYLAAATVPVLCLAFFVSGGALAEIGRTHLAIVATSLPAAVIGGRILGRLWARWRLLRLARRAYRALLSPPLRFSL